MYVSPVADTAPVRAGTRPRQSHHGKQPCGTPSSLKANLFPLIFHDAQKLRSHEQASLAMLM